MADRSFPGQSGEGRMMLPIYEGTEFKAAGMNSRSGYEQLYWNGWPEMTTNAAGEYGSWSFVNRPGSSEKVTLSPTIASYGTADTMVCIAHTVITQLYDIYVAAFYDSTSSKIYFIQYVGSTGATTKIGEITGCNAGDLVFITEITNGAFLLPGIAVSYQAANRSFGTGYYAITVAGVFPAASLTQITHISFPSNLGTPRVITGPFQHMNGHNYIMTIDGFIYESQLTSTNPDITSWNTNATVTSSQYPDRGLGVYRFKYLLIAVGQDSIEFWSPDNNAPPQSSLVRTDQAFIKFGGISPKMVVVANDVLYWLSYGSTDTIGIWQLDGFTPKKISTAREDYHLISVFSGALPYISNCYTMEALMMNNKPNLIINGVPGAIAGSGVMLCFNLADQQWWQMEFPGVAILPATSFGSNYPANSYSQNFFTRTGASTGNSAMFTSGIVGASGTGVGCSTRVFAFNFAQTTYNYVDLKQTNSGTIMYVPYTWLLQLNTKRFQTEVKKVINKIILLTDGGSDGIAVQYTRDSVYGATVNRLMDGNPPRYYSVKCGAARSIHLTFYSRTTIASDQIRVVGVELQLSQGSH